MHIEKIKWIARWRLRKYTSLGYANGLKPFEDNIIEGNILLNAAITDILQMVGGTASPTAWTNGNARIGVGNGTAAESSGQTALQGSSKFFQPVEANYPQVSGQTITYRAVFADGDAEFAWEEFGVVNAEDDSTGTLLNRRVSSQGTKIAGQTWTLDLEITLS